MSTRRPLVAALVALLLTAVVALGACRGDAEIRIFAASSLQDVLPEILDAYAAAHDGATFETQYGGSQALATQLELGASAAIFLSANEQQVDRLEDDGLIVSRGGIATNRLVIAVPSHSSIERVTDLADGSVRIAIGAPEVPVGALTSRALALLDEPLADAIRANVVTEDPNVRVVLSRVELGEVDAAFVYLTDVFAADDIRPIELPVELEPNVYVGALLEGAGAEAANLFDFLASPAVEAIWRNAGFEAIGAQ